VDFTHQELDGGIFVLTVDGDLDNSNSEQFLTDVEELVEDGRSKLIIDCNGMHTITSNGFAVLLRLSHRARKKGGDLKLASPHGMVAQALHMMRLDTVFEVYPDVDRARAAFS
jgi:anti-sigma B factor antagonist